jgi:hypothetical protein
MPTAASKKNIAVVRNMSKLDRVSSASKRRELLEIFAPLVEFFLRAQFESSEIESAVRISLSRAQRARRPFSVKRMGDPEVTSSMVRRWHTQIRYMNANGRASPLPISGKNSFTTLARESGYLGSIDALMRTMVAFGTVGMTTGGKLEPLLRHMNYRRDDVMAFEMNRQFMVDAIAAMTRGMGGVGNSKGLYGFRNVGRGIARKHVKSFLSNIRTRNRDFVDEISQWLDHVSATKAENSAQTGRTYRLGVGVFPICATEK